MNPSTAQALVIVDELLRCGVTDVVLAPGSRSAALALACAAAEERGDLNLHVRLDERVAGFVALGIAKVTGVPAAVITTSGTAVANLLPAVVEAHYSRVPMMVLTADRPPRLRDVGANQTIRQPGIFGSYTRATIDMGVAQERVGQVAYWRSVIARSVAVATDVVIPGPVHVNVPFEAPLVPDSDTPWLEELAGRPDGRPWTADARLMAGMSTPLDDVLQMLDEEAVVPARGVIVVGDHVEDAVELVDELADALAWPIISEPNGNAGGCTTALSHGPLICAQADFLDAHVPDLVITVGRVGLHRSIDQLITRAAMHIAVDPSPEWSDPTRTADLVVASVPLPPEAAEADDEWLPEWQAADVLTAAAVETVLVSAKDELTGMHVARAVAAATQENGMLFLGASLSVRHVSSFSGTAAQEAIVLGNRGTSGIDGCVSTAWGAASALQSHEGGAAIALMGDQAFLYDSNGLLVPDDEERPDLLYVVIDNDGGGIFSTLEQGSGAFDSEFERVFGVPLGISLRNVASSMGVPSVEVRSLSELTDAISSRVGTGTHVIIARTVDRVTEAQLLANINRAVGTALASS